MSQFFIKITLSCIKQLVIIFINETDRLRILVPSIKPVFRFSLV